MYRTAGARLRPALARTTRHTTRRCHKSANGEPIPQPHSAHPPPPPPPPHTQWGPWTYNPYHRFPRSGYPGAIKLTLAVAVGTIAGNCISSGGKWNHKCTKDECGHKHRFDWENWAVTMAKKCEEIEVPRNKNKKEKTDSDTEQEQELKD